MTMLFRAPIGVLNGLIAVAVALGPVGVSGLTSAGSLTAWGGGQIGFPAGLTNIVAISTAIDHSLALSSDGKLVAWGNNFDNQCDVPADLGPVTGLAAGAFFSVALKSDGTVAVWGDNQFSQSQVPVDATNVTAISAGRGAQSRYNSTRLGI